MPLHRVPLDKLIIEDEASFAHVAVYAQLKQMLRRSGYEFHVPTSDTQLSWDRALFLNLTCWNAEEGVEVLCEERIPADVVAHVAWHHLVAKQIARTAPGPACADSLFFAESIASAFDLYLVGRLLRNVPDSDFIATQVSIMGEVAAQAGLPEAEFAASLDAVAEDPERAFEDLRALLFDVSRALLGCRNGTQAQRALEGFAAHRFESLLHHYQLSNWVLSARAYAVSAPAQEQLVRAVDAILRQAPVSLDWLVKEWLPSQ